MEEKECNQETRKEIKTLKKEINKQRKKERMNAKKRKQER